MKTTFTLLAAMLFTATVGFSQGNDTLIYENFNVDPTGNSIIVGVPTGNDPTWINFDADFVNDANSRPMEWYWDSTGFATDDTTGAFWSSSWLTPSAASQNWLLSPAINIIDTTAKLSWRSAPFQTPRYLDGYFVLVSTTDNIEASFTDTLMAFAEYTGGTGTPTANWANYQFTPGYVHGINGNFIEFSGDSGAYTGIMEPHQVSLAQYTGQTIHIAFFHYSDDDNLIAIDDILVKGTMSTGISEATELSGINIFPNPASDKVEIAYTLKKTTPVALSVYDINGKLVKDIVRNTQIAGYHTFSLDVTKFATGVYNVVLKTPFGVNTTKLIVE